MRILMLLALLLTGTTLSAQQAPWGTAQVVNTKYPPMKVVYDVDTGDMETFESVLDRASYLTKITGVDPFASSTILVMHGDSIDYFAIKNFAKYHELVERTKGLIDSDLLEIRMCRIAAASRGFEPADIHGFITMVPMGDAEIVRLQVEEGHAYMR